MSEHSPSKESFSDRFVNMWYDLIESAAKHTLRYTRTRILFVEADKEIERLQRELASFQKANAELALRDAHEPRANTEGEVGLAADVGPGGGASASASGATHAPELSPALPPPDVLSLKSALRSARAVAFHENGERFASLVRLIDETLGETPSSLCVCGEPNSIGVQHRTDGPCIQITPTKSPTTEKDGSAAVHEAASGGEVPPERTLMPDLAEAIKSGVPLVKQLRAGHETGDGR